MRCKCCNAQKTIKWGEDYYCSSCAASIKETIAEDAWIEESFEYGRSYGDTEGGRKAITLSREGRK